MGYCGDCEYLTNRHNCKKYKKGLAYSSYSSRSISTGAIHERCSECDKDYRIAELEEKIKHQWISVEERLPECEKEVLIQTERGKITTAMYEDGKMSDDDSLWNWTDMDFDYDEDTDTNYIPEGWWEYRHFNPDDVYDNAVDEAVIYWMPLPELYKEAEG